MLNTEQIRNYLGRIGLDDSALDAKRDYDLLCRLQFAHVTTVPYENLDILRGVDLKLDIPSLYEKIVIRRRGGYCFELNGLFAELLRSLGFEITDHMARYLRGETEIPMRRHRVIVVHNAGDCDVLCDVGIGDSAARLPLLMTENAEQKQYGECYRITRNGFYGHVVSDFHKGQWRPQYGFTDEIQLDIDYIMPSFYCERHPQSPFTKEEIVAVKTATGRKTLSGHTYRVFDGGSVTEREIDPSEMPRVLRDEFGI